MFIRHRKLNISLVFISQTYFSVQKEVRLSTNHYFIVKINGKRELQNITLNHSADLDYRGFLKIYSEFTKELYSFSTINTTIPTIGPLRFRKNLFCSYKHESN